MKKKMLTKDTYIEAKMQGKNEQEIADEFEIGLTDLNDWIKKNPTIIKFSEWEEIL